MLEFYKRIRHQGVLLLPQNSINHKKLSFLKRILTDFYADEYFVKKENRQSEASKTKSRPTFAATK